MAWFNFGKKDSAPLQDAPVETVETLRTRAKRRLIGALVLVLTAVVGFPLLFDTQPRPLLTNVPIEIPDKNKVKPLTPPQSSPPQSSASPAASKPAAAATTAGAAAAGAAAAGAAAAGIAKVEDKASLSGKEEIIAGAAGKKEEKKQEKVASAGTNTAPAATKTVATPSSPTAAEKAASDKAAAEKAASDKAAAEKAAAQKTAADKAKTDAQKAAAEKAKSEASKAQALLDGKAATGAASASTSAAAAAGNAASEGRYIVQFGSFADNAKAREARLKVEKAGFKTYVQVAETAQGKLIRVRVGPYATKAEAEKAAAKIKTLDLPAAILTL